MSRCSQNGEDVCGQPAQLDRLRPQQGPPLPEEGPGGVEHTRHRRSSGREVPEVFPTGSTSQYLAPLAFAGHAMASCAAGPVSSGDTATTVFCQPP